VKEGDIVGDREEGDRDEGERERRAERGRDR